MSVKITVSPDNRIKDEDGKTDKFDMSIYFSVEDKEKLNAIAKLHKKWQAYLTEDGFLKVGRPNPKFGTRNLHATVATAMGGIRVSLGRGKYNTIRQKRFVMTWSSEEETFTIDIRTLIGEEESCDACGRPF